MKELYEWARSWSDCATKNNLPRILLIGDSITEGYSTIVREILSGQCYVDYFATSYAVDSKIYQTLVSAFINDNTYEIIHYNHGLHGKNMSAKNYLEGVKKCLNNIKCKIILALTTEVLNEDNIGVDETWKDKIKERNEALKNISIEYGCSITDLYTLSKKISSEFREKDGVHFTKNGYKLLAEQVVKNIKENL